MRNFFRFSMILPMDVRVRSEALLPTRWGVFKALAFASGGVDHLALVKGEVTGEEGVLTRVHSECLTGDLFGSRRCDCGSQLQKSLERIGKAEKGVLVYLRDHEGRGIGLAGKLMAYALQERGRDTVEANLELGLPVDARKYGIAAAILRYLGISSLRLLTNNPAKIVALEECGLVIMERIPLVTEPTPDNLHYLLTKQRKLGHLFSEEALHAHL